MKIPHHLQRQFALAISDLQETVGWEATKAYLSSLSRTIETTINENNPNVDRPTLQIVNNKSSEAIDVPGSALGVDGGISSSLAALCERCHSERSKQQPAHVKKRKREDPLDSVIEHLPRPNLIEFLAAYWEPLKTNELYAHPSIKACGWTLEGEPAQDHRLHHHLVLRQLQTEDDLHQWRRSIAEIRNLEGYRAFVAEASRKRTTHQQLRQRGEKDSDKAHKDYILHIFANRPPEDIEKAKQALKKDLRYGRQWSILVDGFLEDNQVVPGLGLGVLLLCGPSIKRKMLLPWL